MKNLSAILRLSPSETFTILITLVVCLAGFTEAEVQTNYRTQDANQQPENYHLKQNVPYTHQTSKMTDMESEDGNVANFRNIPELPLEKLMKRHSDEFGESDESDEKESDGYGYDDDEYYHFNFKRNDESLENSKIEKEGVHDSNEKEGISGQKQSKMNQNAKEKTKELETIEMLNFKESHPNIDPEGNPTSENAKPYSEELNRKKVPSSSNILNTLKMSDLREASAIDEKMKDRKDESSLSSGSSETKTSDAKKSVKLAEDKETVKVKDSKLTEDAEQKDKETSLKDGKEAVVAKTIKESPKSSEEKEKGVKLSDSAKLEDSIDKLTGKVKENDPSKLISEDTLDVTRFADKVTSDVINPSGLNQISNRASFVSNDYKDNADAMKAAGVDEYEKTSEEASGMEGNVGLSDYQDDLRRSEEKLRKFYSQRDVEGNRNYESFNARDNTAQIFRDSNKPKEYAQLALELQNLNPSDLKDTGLEGLKFISQQPQRQQAIQGQQQQQQQQFMQMQQQLSTDMQSSQRQADMNSDSRYKNAYGINFQPSEIENTEYHKNYIKSLKRYKGLNAEQKAILSDISNTGSPQRTTLEESRNMKKKLQEPVKWRSMDMSPDQKQIVQAKHPNLRRIALRDLLSGDSHRNPAVPQTLCKPANADPKLTEGKKQEEQQEANRARRKSPIKLEYEIKVINQNSQDSKNTELSHIAPRRFEKDVKTKLSTEEKYLKKYPYSQVSREDLTRLSEPQGERKFKRKAPIWKRRDKKSVIQTRAVPSGYYSNRVKFGQRNYARNNERSNVEPASLDSGHISSSYLSSDAAPSRIDKTKLQRSWEVRQQDYRHDPMKRYDESGYMNKGNSLLLVRKGQKTATTFEEGSPHTAPGGNLSPDNLAKILSKDNGYIVLKKTDSNKFQKISESNPPTASHVDSGGGNYPNKLSQDHQRENLKGSSKQTLKNKGLFVRSFHPEKEDKKFSSASHSSKSNLKKTFDKFRDLAGFFKDNEQESTDNHYSAQELKEGRDIVFSEDKLPDPIVINNDGTGKNTALNQKQQNSIYSISTNFKTLDQQDKKNDVPASSEADKNMLTAEAKSDSSESSWEPTLRNIFPEAKSINSMSKNGNEIIILDLNRNQLKTDHFFGNQANKMASKAQQYGAFGLTSQVPGGTASPNDNSIQLMLSPVVNKFQTQNKVPQKSPFTNTAGNKAYAFVRAGDNQPNQVSLRNLVDIPTLLKTLTEKKSGAKLLTKRSPPGQLSENYKKFLTELNELSELNKSSYRKGKLAKKRTTEEIALPPSSFPELSNYGDANIRYLGNLLHNIMTGENPEFKGIEGAESSYSGIPKSLEGSLKSNHMRLDSAVLEPNCDSKYQKRWLTAEEKSKDNIGLDQNKAGAGLLVKEVAVPGDSLQDELLAELTAASDKINRLRREGVGMHKTLALNGKSESKTLSTSSELKSEEKCSKLDSESVSLSAKDKVALQKRDHDTKESSDKSMLKSNYETHLSKFFENLNKNQKDQANVPNENTWKRKKRKENHRRKRSASRDVKNKVSTTAVQNTILKNLAEDNYQSVYSPGINRRLFSTNNEADDADNYSDAYESDKNVIVEEAQPKCVKSSLNKCIDPMIVELFEDVDKEEDKTRARRSLASHSNFKREIDLDESMPNDFQNFLVTSLGGFGSQNREVIKKDVALWERKESTQDSNQIAESSPLPGGKEDPNATLEKREIPSNENRKGQTYFPSGANSDSSLGDVMGPLNHEKKARSDNKSKLKSKAEFADEKLPTQIRIQITNASSKEKKSSKPIMEESETASTEMENLPKEKEFFDKNKINTLRLNNLPKLHGSSKNKFSFYDYEENDNGENNSQGSYRLHRRRRKKKKYVPENPIKPIKDFIKFDQKTMETFLKKIIADQSMAADQTTQKSPVSNHLPQVETVYNPTQGTDKAQLEVSRFGKMSSANNKNTGTAKNNMPSTDSMGYDEGILRNYLKDKTDKIKSDKVKEFEDVDWKPRYGKMRLRQELGWEPSTNNFNMATLKTPLTDSSSFPANKETPPYMSPFNQHLYKDKNQVPNSNYFFHPSGTNSGNSNGLYNSLKLKQEIKNQNPLTSDHSTSKLFKKPFYYNNGDLFKSDEKERNQSPLFPSLNSGDASWNYDYSLNKKPGSRGFKSRDFFTSGIKAHNHMDSKSKIAHGGSRKFMKNIDDEKSSLLDNPQSSSLENTKDPDYLDNQGADDDYLDDDSGKEFQNEESLMSVPLKYRRLFSSDADDNINEDEEEVDEDYDENSEEDDPDDYSLLANTKVMEPELTKNSHRKSKFQDSYNDDSALSQVNYVYPRDNLLQLRGHSFEQTEFTNKKNDEKFASGRQPIGLSDIKNDMGSQYTSNGLLKKANENANIFGKNVMKNTYGYNSDKVMPSQLPDRKLNELNTFYNHNKLFKRKMDTHEKLKRSRDFPQIGSRLFYAAKTEINDNFAGPTMFLNQVPRKSRNSRHAYCRRNPLNVEFADPDNSFDNESEGNGNENLLDFEKNLPKDEDKDTEEDEDEDFEEVAENMEDDGDTISEDNVMENVIGKYIMRKRVASSDDLNKSENPQAEGNHELEKRSLEQQKRDKTRDLKMVKRLSSGHLTENNFRKYHKKNLTRKREVNESATHETGRTTLMRTRKREIGSKNKRSALDLFKKITNKDRDSKKVENVDGRTAGFEPLSSLSDKKYESSIRDTKFEFLNQVKKLSNESPQTQIKSTAVELKPHYPFEGQFTADQGKKDKVKMIIKENPGTTGPWKIELNNRYDLRLREFPKTVDSIKEALPASATNENLKAFLVFCNNLGAYKRSAPGVSPASGSSQKEVGNSYRPKSGEGRRISKMHVSKRSLDSSVVATNDEDAAHTTRDRFTSGQTTETHVDIEEKNRALHDTRSLSEGDSKPQPLQRNTKKIRSFVNDDEQCPNARFPPVGSSNNRMPLFPPSNDENIMRDSRQVNEETSKYLGQQIVGAILSHVSANPKFKEMIAPGLLAKTTAYKEDIDVTKKPLHHADISDQLQYFLQKFMHDLEKLAEKHVRKRMCTQIDEQSKEFLQSLLSVPRSTQTNSNENFVTPEDYFELDNAEEVSTTPTTTEEPMIEPPVTPSPVRNSAGELENLRMKHCLLLKLIDDYEKLTKLEKDSLRVHYQYLLEELEETNKELGSLNPIRDSEMCSRKLHNIPSDINRNLGFDALNIMEKQNANFRCSNCTACPQAKHSQQKWQCDDQLQGPEESNPVPSEPTVKMDQKNKTQNLPTLAFEEDTGRNRLILKVTPTPIFETVDPVNLTGSIPKSKGFQNVSHERLHLKEAESLIRSSQTPQTFDLLPFPNATEKMDSIPFSQPPESIRFQQILSGMNNFENFDDLVNFQNPNHLTELHKLSLGDAAGLQLSLKSRGPWVSNLDVAKTIRNVPLPLAESREMKQLPDSELKEDVSAPRAERAAIDYLSVAKFKGRQSLNAPMGENPDYSNPTSKKKDNLALALSPYVNLGMVMPKSRPFESVSKSVEALGNDRIPVNYFLNKVSSSGSKRVFIRSNDLPPPSSHNYPRGANYYPQLVKVAPQSQVVNPKSSEARSQTQYIVLQPPKVRMQSPNVLLQSDNVLTQPAQVFIKPSDDMVESVNALKQPLDAIMRSANPLTQPSEPIIQSTEVLTQPSNAMIQSSNIQKQPAEVLMEPLDAIMKSASILTQPKEVPMQPSYIRMEPLNVLMQPSDIRMQPSEINMQSQDVQKQSTDDRMQPYEIITQSPDIQAQGSDVRIQPSEINMQSPDVQAHSTDAGMQPSDIIMQSPDIQTLSTDAKMQSSEIAVQSPDVRAQGTDVMMPSAQVPLPSSDVSSPSEAHFPSSDVPIQSPNDSSPSSDVQKQVPDILSQSSVFQMLSPFFRTDSPKAQEQPPDDKNQFSDITKLSPMFPIEPPFHQEPPKAQEQPPEDQNQLSDISKQSPMFPIAPPFQAEPPKAEELSPSDAPQKAEPESANNLFQNNVSQKDSQCGDKQGNPTNAAPVVCSEDSQTKSHNELLNYPRERKPFQEHECTKKHRGRHKKIRLFSHFPFPGEKKNKEKHRNKSKKSLNARDDDDEKDEVEYLAWSQMPAVRRQLNKLEAGLELDDFFLKNPKAKKILREAKTIRSD